VHNVGFSDVGAWSMPIYQRLYFLNKYKKELKEQKEQMDKVKKK
jgi:hypothetical protein